MWPWKRKPVEPAPRPSYTYTVRLRREVWLDVEVESCCALEGKHTARHAARDNVALDITDPLGVVSRWDVDEEGWQIGEVKRHG